MSHLKTRVDFLASYGAERRYLHSRLRCMSKECRQGNSWRNRSFC